MKKKYVTSKKECQAIIDNANRVCDRCGRKLKPIKTANNSGAPTYWVGCFHGQNKNSWGHFTHGTSKEIFNMAEKLVCDGESCAYNPKEKFKDSPEDRLCWFQTEVSGFCFLLSKAEYLKNNKSRKTKKEFLENKYF